MNMKYICFSSFCIKMCQGNRKSLAWKKYQPQQNRWRIVFDQWTGTVNRKVVCSAEYWVWISLCVFCHQWNIQSHKINFSTFSFRLCSFHSITSSNTSGSECNPSEHTVFSRFSSTNLMMMVMMNGPIILYDICAMRYGTN